MGHLRRIVDGGLDDPFSQVPAIAVDGPKAVGKTPAAKQCARNLLMLDSRANRASIQADPELWLPRSMTEPRAHAARCAPADVQVGLGDAGKTQRLQPEPQPAGSRFCKLRSWNSITHGTNASP